MLEHLLHIFILGMNGDNTDSQKLNKIISEIQALQEVVARFRQLRLDATEFACLKCIVTFKAGKQIQTVVFSSSFAISLTQFSSVAQLCPNPCDPMDCSTPGLPVYHQLPELTQTHVHSVSDAIQPSHPLSSPSPPTFNLSQHQGLLKCVSSSHQVAKVLEFQL